MKQDKDYEWFLTANLTEHEGKYIVIAKQRVVCVGDDPGEVYEEAKPQFPGEEVVLWKIPLGETFIFGGVP